MTTSLDTIACRDESQRRADVLAHPTLNGIDFVEVDPANHRKLRVVFLEPLPPGGFGVPADPTKIAIDGGTRIVGIRAVAAAVGPDGELEIDVDQAGDYSLYTLTIDVPELDPVLNHVAFSFMASCPVDADCRTDVVCPPARVVEPSLDYLAKDYASFRRLLLDLVPQLNADFVERSPADLGIALIELFAQQADYLSYFQDAVANEAFLETVRHRISARRHARLIDYRMHDGRNAWTAVDVRARDVGGIVPGDVAGTLSQGTKIFTRVSAPLAGETQPPPVVVPDERVTAATLETDPALATTIVFETAHPIDLFLENNEIRIHTFGNDECCLPKGTREAYLYSLAQGTAVRPVLKRGDRLVFEEVRGPRTGAPADDDPAHRQVVLLSEDPEETEDPVYADSLAGDELQLFQPGGQPLPLLRVRWRREDALAFPVCISARPEGVGALRNVSVARGNIVLADHGLTTNEELAPPRHSPRAGRVRLRGRGLTMECEPAEFLRDPATALPRTARLDLDCSVREVRPAVALLAEFPTGPELWRAVPDLLESTPFDSAFVAEVDNDGRAFLRFGDGEFGRRIDDATSLTAVYRIGNGRAGNVGAESLSHLATDDPVAFVEVVRNPLPAGGGVDPETVEQVRQHAPQAFHAEQLRAVTEADYSAVARKLPEVAGAVASFRWTGSWYTVFVGLDPRDPADLVRGRGGRTLLSPALQAKAHTFLTRFRLAGYDLELRAPTFVPIELDLRICVAPGYFRGDVAHAVAEVLGPRGFFHPDNFTFGDAVYLSRIYAAVEHVEGVDSVVATRLRRFGQSDNGELDRAVLPIAAWEIAELGNDPNFLERGVLRIETAGGKA